MRYVTADPGFLLGQAVSALWYLDTPRLHEFEQVLPMPGVELILNLSDPYTMRSGDGADEEVPAVFLTGVRSRIVAFRNPARIRHVAVRMPVFGPSRFGLESGEIVTEVDGDLGADLRASAAHLNGGRDPDQLLAVVHLVLERYLRPETDAQRTVRLAVAALFAQPTRTIADVAAAVGVSHKTLIARFRRVAGTRPSRLAQLILLDAFMRKVPAKGRLPSWTHLVAESPYADQSHFIRSFKRVVGVTPRQYLEARATSRYEDPRFVPGDFAR